MVKVANNIDYKFKKKTIFPLRRRQSRQEVIQPNECLTRFNDLSDEILLMICRYLTPAHVLQAFLDYNDRMFACISEYRHKMNLSGCSYTDLQYFLKLLTNKKLRPSTLILSNFKFPTQIQIFAEQFMSNRFHFVRHLSLLECTEDDLDDMDLLVKMFHSLQSLTITESTLNIDQWLIEYSTIDLLRNLIFDNPFDVLTVLELSTINGIVLDKKLRPNMHLKQMTISLEKIDDLLVLFDGLVPSLMVLNVTLCKSRTSKRSLLPQCWPRQYMYHLIEFQLITDETVAFSFDHLKGIVMPLIKVHKLTLDISQWTNNNQQFIEGNQIDTLIGQFMTQLRYFHCFIQTASDIDIKSFGMLNERWPMACGSPVDNSSKHAYTVPWPFETDELLTHSIIHSNIQHLILQTTQIISLNIVKSLVQNFPNLYSLEIELESNDEYYDSLDILLGNEHLPYLSFLRTNWIDDDTSNIQIWIAANTPLKWRTTPIYGECDDDGCLTICL